MFAMSGWSNDGWWWWISPENAVPTIRTKWTEQIGNRVSSGPLANESAETSAFSPFINRKVRTGGLMTTISMKWS